MNSIQQSLCRELAIYIRPRYQVSFYGTAEQLTQEGLIPVGFTWPQRTEWIEYKLGEYSFTIGRHRPPWENGRTIKWASVDYWFLRRHLTNSAKTMGFDCEIYEILDAYKQYGISQTPEGVEQFNRCWKAQCDSSYQSFRAKVIPPQEKPVKAKRIPSPQQALPAPQTTQRSAS